MQLSVNEIYLRAFIEWQTGATSLVFSCGGRVTVRVLGLGLELGLGLRLGLRLGFGFKVLELGFKVRVHQVQ